MLYLNVARFSGSSSMVSQAKHQHDSNLYRELVPLVNLFLNVSLSLFFIQFPITCVETINDVSKIDINICLVLVALSVYIYLTAIAFKWAKKVIYASNVDFNLGWW